MVVAVRAAPISDGYTRIALHMNTEHALECTLLICYYLLFMTLDINLLLLLFFQSNCFKLALLVR